MIRKGKTVVQYRDESLQVNIGYRYASTHLDSRWIFLDAYLSSTGNKPVEIDREDVQLVTPNGTLPLPTQKRLGAGNRQIRRDLNEAAISRDPLDGYFPGRTRRENLAFFTVPGEGIVFDRVTVNREILAAGDLWFESPTGFFAPGRYELRIRNKQVDVRVPFTLPADDEPLGRRKDQNDKTVPW